MPPMCDFPREDPRDAASEACAALLGVVFFVSERTEPIDPKSLGSMLRLIFDRLDPACEAMQNFVPRV
jgi:hypothetical protein